MAEPLLSLAGVHTHIGRYHILQGVDLAVPRRGLTALLGRNGAGKTTTLRTIMGLWRASAGTVRFDGADIAALATPDIARLGVAYVPENMGIFAGLTVEENLLLAAREGALPPDRLARIHALFPPLQKFRDLAAGALSGGQKQMLALARAMIEPRRLLLVDEPTKGLSPAVVAQLRQAFEALKAETPILLVEQNLAFAAALADTVVVIDDGRTVHAGPMAALAADAEMQRRWLGLDLGARHAG